MSTYKLERNFNKKVPGWQTILENFNWSLVNKKFTKHISPGFFVSLDAHLIKEVKESLEKLKCKTAHLYISTCVGPTYGKHKDDIDVYFWQVQGIAEWIVDNHRIILSPGDLITVKKDVYHEVVPKTPRAGISMSKI
jgi:mannose-6-phosphate isomerase-like protein (cupin superfamily)|tara:strand:- start:3206 stop:3616 length:411 start_codon:yes stop_codon:yes gene_type:complete